VSEAAPALRAALGMYDFPSTAQAQDIVWKALAARLDAAGLPAPAGLTRGADPEAAATPDNWVFAQTCGYPFISGLHRRMTLVATPIYDFPGCVGARHRSFVIANKADARHALAEFRGARAVINGRDSNSGMNLFRAMIAPLAGDKPFFADVAISGAHAASLHAVAAGEADLASIDCVTFGLMARERPEMVAKVRVVDKSPLSPGLPFVISSALAASHLATLRHALVEVLADPDLAPARAALGLAGAQILQIADYDRVAQFERDAIGAGYPVLA